MNESMQEKDVQFLLGQLSGQLAALQGSMTTMATQLSALDTRLQKNENETSKLTVKIGLLAIVAGGVGSLLMELSLKYIFK